MYVAATRRKRTRQGHCHISRNRRPSATQGDYSAWRDKYYLLSKVYFIFEVVQYLIYKFIDIFSMSKHTIIIG
nr:MAG TPA: hypothetical protein [Caudoviricetes sp.]